MDLNPNAVKHTSYSLDLLYENLAKLSKEKQPQSMMIVLDACFSGMTDKGMLIKDASPITLEIASPALKIRDAAIFSSSRSNQISSWYPEQKHGLFTYHFLRALRDSAKNGKSLTVAELESKLLAADGVNEMALRLYSREQTPQVIGNKDIILLK